MVHHHHHRNHNHNHLSALTPSETTHLATLLTLPPRLFTAGHPSSLWLATQAHRLAAAVAAAAATPPTNKLGHPVIPTALLATAPHSGNNLLARLAAAAHRALVRAPSDARRRAVLCPAHKALNAQLVRRVFRLVDAEITRKAAPLRRFLAHPSRYPPLYHHHHHHHYTRQGSSVKAEEEEHRDEEVVRGLVDRLAGLAALWLAPAAFVRRYPDVRLPRRRRLHDDNDDDDDGGSGGFVVRMRSGCEACILAAIGGDAVAVRDLRAAVLGRTHARKGTAPVLSGLVDAWMAGLPGEDGEMCRGESEALGRVAKRVRRAVWKGERQGGKESGGSRSKSRTADMGSAGEVGRGGARDGGDSGYGTASSRGGGGSSTVERFALESLGAEDGGQHASSSRGVPRPRRREGDNDQLLRNAVAHGDIYLHKGQCLHQSVASNTSTHAHELPSACAPAAYDSKSSDDDLSDDQNDDDHDDDDEEEEDEEEENDPAWRSHARASGRYSTHTDVVDADQHHHPAFRCTSTTTLLGGSKVSRAEGVGPRGESKDEVYDPAQWTDVSVSTRSTRLWMPDNWPLVDDGGEKTVPSIVSLPFVRRVASCSSSVYSTDAMAMPHPSPLVTPCAAPSTGTTRSTSSSSSSGSSGSSGTETNNSSRMGNRHTSCRATSTDISPEELQSALAGLAVA